MNTSHDENVNNYTLIEEGPKTKQFWKYVKSNRPHKSFIKCLIKNILVFTKLKEILNALNDTFRDVQVENANLEYCDNGNLTNIPIIPKM